MPAELRVDWSKGTASLDGYALKYDTPYAVYGGPPFGWTETIVAGAAERNLLDDVRLLLNHAGTPLARTSSGSLTLESDRTGLRARAPSLDLRNPDVQTLVSAAERGDLSQMSFAFLVDEDRDHWNQDFTERHIAGFDEIRDVAPVTFPASPTTSFKVRGDAGVPLSLARMIADDFALDDDGRARVAASMARLKYLTPRKELMSISPIEARLRRVGL